MSKEQILALLFVERDKLSRAIEALGGPKRRGRPPGTRNKLAPAKGSGITEPKRKLSAAGRKAKIGRAHV